MPHRNVTPDTVALLHPQLLAEVRADKARTWALQALCIGADPETFFPFSDGPAAEARRICSRCPVRGHCLAYAVIADERHGIWGGLDSRERASLRRRLPRPQSPGGQQDGSAA